MDTSGRLTLVFTAGSAETPESVRPFVVGGRHGNASGPLFPGSRRRTQLHPRCRTMPCGAALAHAGHQAVGGGARWTAVPSRAGQHAPFGTRVHGETVP